MNTDIIEAYNYTFKHMIQNFTKTQIMKNKNSCIKIMWIKICECVDYHKQVSRNRKMDRKERSRTM